MHQLEAEFMFAAAHRLPRYQGKCVNMHGHNYKLGVVLRDLLDPDEVAMTIRRIDRLLSTRRHPLPSDDWPPVPWPPF